MPTIRVTNTSYHDLRLKFYNLNLTFALDLLLVLFVPTQRQRNGFGIVLVKKRLIRPSHYQRLVYQRKELAYCVLDSACVIKMILTECPSWAKSAAESMMDSRFS